MNNFFIKVKSSTFYTICSLKKHRRNISLIKVKYWKNVLLLIKYYWCIASRLSRSSQNSRKNIFLSSRSDGRADIHLLVVIFVMNELWVTETHCLEYFSSMDICIFLSPCQFDLSWHVLQLTPANCRPQIFSCSVHKVDFLQSQSLSDQSLKSCHTPDPFLCLHIHLMSNGGPPKQVL